MTYQGRTPAAETMMRTIHFDHPAWVPVRPGILPAAWLRYGEALDEILVAHPRIFPNYQPVGHNPPLEGLYADGRHTDCWGCVWETVKPGVIGQVVQHPLADWSAWNTWRKPDPLRDDLLEPRDWNAIGRAIAEKKRRGEFDYDYYLFHGFHLLRICDMRGFENAMMDMITDEPMLHLLVDVIVDYNAAVVGKLIELGSEYIALAEDLGHQAGPLVGLEMWRHWVLPGYEATVGQARDAGIPIFLHSDGHILPLLEDLRAAGVTVINMQLRANGLQAIKEQVKGRMVICIDLDRQLFPRVGPEALADHVREVYEALYMPEGGLIMGLEIGDDVPLENIEALLSTLENVCGLPEAG